MKRLILVFTCLLVLSHALHAQDVIERDDIEAINANAPRFKFKEGNMHDFGTLTPGDIVKHRFEYVNMGKDPLVIVNISTSCGCTIPEWTKEPVKAGEKGVITIQFTSEGQHGAFEKEISVQSNAATAGEFEKLYIKGIVAEKNK